MIIDQVALLSMISKRCNHDGGYGGGVNGDSGR